MAKVARIIIGGVAIIGGSSFVLMLLRPVFDQFMSAMSMTVGQNMLYHALDICYNYVPILCLFIFVVWSLLSSQQNDYD